MAKAGEGYRSYNIRLPAGVYARIVQLAEQEKRSINGELNVLVELGLKHTRRRGKERAEGTPEGEDDDPEGAVE